MEKLNGRNRFFSNGSSVESKIKTEKAMLTTQSGYTVEKSDLVRIMIQSMKALGYRKSSEMLEKESGVRLEESFVMQFREKVQEGDWEAVRALLPKMNLTPADTTKATMLIHRQEFLELLEEGKMKEALAILRNLIAPKNPDRAEVNLLSSLVMYPNVEDMKRAANWKGVDGGSRLKILDEVQKLMDPSYVVPGLRMLTLVDQALTHQISQCQFHNAKITHFSLLHDHHCSLGEIPQACISVLHEHKDEVWHVAFSHSGTRLASASKDKSVILWAIEPTRKLEHKLVGHHKAPSFVAWSPDDSRILSTDNLSCFRVWDAKSGELVLSVPSAEKEDASEPDSVLTCSWHPNGEHIVCARLLEKKIVTYDLKGKQVSAWAVDQMIRDLAITPPNLIVMVGTSHTVKAFNLATKKREGCPITETSPVTSFCMSQDGRYALISVSHPAGIKLWDLTTGEVVRHYEGIKQSRYVVQASFGGAEETFVVSGSEDSQVYIWHRSSGELLAVLPGHSGTVNCVSWSPKNPTLFVSASDDSTIRIWSVRQKNGNASHNGDIKVK
uniref:CTLH domain-containing protein n=1 Tax=Lotharella oceanica TaxID=641309 RepID=A0A7S2TZV2_9EUKA